MRFKHHLDPPKGPRKRGMQLVESASAGRENWHRASGATVARRFVAALGGSAGGQGTWRPQPQQEAVPWRREQQARSVGGTDICVYSWAVTPLT